MTTRPMNIRLQAKTVVGPLSMRRKKRWLIGAVDFMKKLRVHCPMIWGNIKIEQISDYFSFLLFFISMTKST